MPRCKQITDDENSFLSVYELRKKFRYLIHKTTEKNEKIRDLSSCVIETFSVCDMIKLAQKYQI